MADADDSDQSTPRDPPKPPRKVRTDVPPQQSIDEFWKKFTTKQPGKVFTILPDNLYAKRASLYATWKSPPAKNAVASYEEAAAACRLKVDKIARDCRRLNQKYKDPHFDVEFDFLRYQWYGRTEDCLTALGSEQSSLRPMSVKRVEDIFDEPHFYIEGATAGDVRQGRDGDCWLMSSICTLSNKEDLLEKVCVARDEKVGVYGFVFHRDGEWTSEVIDDKLYLIKEDWEESFWERFDWLQVDMPNQEEEYRKVMQSGSKALYFAQCRDQNETWLPLMEKAYAKAHGDYATIEGGWVGEGLEDLTGGVTSELFSTDILDKDKFWNDELMNVNKTFLFGLAQMGGLWGERKGIVEQHAYSIMEARELDNFRLLKIRNPWGKKEWEGAWSDGSEQWSPDRMKRLNHTFGNDGVFWISYKDCLKNFQHIDRTRLFGSDWSITQQWTSVNVPWSVNYLATHFKLSLPKKASVVLVLSQLDERYFNGLTGQYDFQLQFRLHKDGAEDYIVRNNPSYFMTRSVNTDLELEAGNYILIFKITATRSKKRASPEQVIRENCEKRPEKLLAVGLSYDLAHAKGRLKESAQERKQRLREERRERRKKQAKRTFDAKKAAEKKSKLGKKRKEAKTEAKEKAKKKAEDSTNTPKHPVSTAPSKQVSVTVQVGDNTVSMSKPQGIDEIEGGKFSIEQEIKGKTVRVSIHPSEKDISEEASKDQQESILDKAKEHGSTTDPGSATVATTAPESSSSGTSGVTPSTSRSIAPADDQINKSTAETDATRKNTDVAKMPAEEAPKTLTLDDVSDSGLSWASDVDCPSDTPASSSSDDGYSSPDEAPPPPPPDSHNDDNKDKDNTGEIDFAADPWNAVAVVGLRCYCQGSQVDIEVVPGREDAKKAGSAGGKEEQGSKGPENKKLDVDDQAADATKGLAATGGAGKKGNGNGIQASMERLKLEGESGVAAAVEKDRQG